MKPLEPELYAEDLEMLAVLDEYKSLIWTERYNKVGDFEYQTLATTELMEKIKPGCYLRLPRQDTAMIVETLKIETDEQNANILTVSGRSVESILERRIVWAQTDLNSKIETAIERLLNENVINPSIPERKIPGFLFQKSSDSRLNDISVDKQFTGDNLLEAIQTLCVTANVGFRIHFDPDHAERRFIFELYYGEDRSYAQDTNPWVIFSPGFDNLLTSNYINSKKLVKNVVNVKGEGEGTARKEYTIVLDNNPTGLARREMYVDARDISQNSDETTEDGEPIPLPDSEYREKLRARGYEKLAEIDEETSFEGAADMVEGVFVYGRDFFMGDILQVENEYGMKDAVRVTELIQSCDTSGFTVYPTFMSTSKKEEVSSS